MTGGSGKTFLASAIGGELIKRYEASVRLVNASGLLDLSQEKHRDMQDPPGSLNACRVNNKSVKVFFIQSGIIRRLWITRAYGGKGGLWIRSVCWIRILFWIRIRIQTDNCMQLKAIESN